MRKQIVWAGVLLTACLPVFSGCGGGDDNMEFEGTVRNSRTATLAPNAPLPAVVVCALGQCDTTDENGQYSFEVNHDDFDGGSVLYTLRGANINDNVVVRNLSDETEVVTAEFQATDNGEARLTLLEEDDVQDDLGEEISEEVDDVF